MIIDTHTHIFMNKKHNETDIMTKLSDDNIEKILSIWIDIETSIKSIDLAKKYQNTIYATIGIHPSDVSQFDGQLTATINQLENLLINNLPFVKAIWECWFDYHRLNGKEDEYIKNLQKEFFVAQIKLAQKYSLPIVIHTRDAKNDTLETIKETGLKKFVLHCFSEDLDFAYKALYYSEECKISFSWIVTYPNAKNVRQTASVIPLSRILVETDCPFLAPQPVRGSENIPNNTKYNLLKIFELRKEAGKNETFEEFENQIYQNSKDFFWI